MTDDILPPLSESGRFSPVAMALTLVLHAAVAAGLWWLEPFRALKPSDEVIEVTVDRGGAPPVVEPTPAPEQQPQQAPPQSLALPKPTPAPEPEPKVAQAPEPPKPRVEEALPPPEPPPPPTAMDFPKPAPPPPPPKPQPPRQQAQPPQKSPLTPRQAPQPADNQTAAAPAPSPLRNPADVIIGPSGPSQNDYFTQLARKLASFRYYPQSARDRHQEGRVVVRVVIARNGQLLDARVERSSGVPAIDEAELDTVRRAAPYPPLPFNMAGERVTFLIPVNYELR